MRNIRLKLQQLRNPNCTACPLHKTEGNVCVMGKGPYSASIVLVGEAPGEAEAKTGKPFMGRAGKLLDEILEELQMKKLCYITNVVRCRPPENRKPEDSEVRRCADLYYWKELQIIVPRVIVLMGRTSSDYTLHHHQPHYTRGVMYNVLGVLDAIATWHPSYLLRTQDRQWRTRKEFTEHLKLAKSVVETH